MSLRSLPHFERVSPNVASLGQFPGHPGDVRAVVDARVRPPLEVQAQAGQHGGEAARERARASVVRLLDVDPLVVVGRHLDLTAKTKAF